MGNFKGFEPDIFTLLELNKFNDSKDFYESVKDEIKKKAIEPMRYLASDLSEELYKIDDKMNLIPSKMVSRIRRDTRFSKNKDLYRSNVWCMFMRDKHQWMYQPCMWFEYFPDSYGYGVGMFRTDADYLQCFREYLTEHQQEFSEAIRLIEVTGATCNIESYKKEKPGTENISPELRKFYNCKNIWFVHYSNDMKVLVDGSVKTELIYALRAFTPFYRFLLNVTEKMYEKGDYNE
ncbi:MAG: DUF2461 domain-containing protein [Clostridia bacterium]|nr:DUF2461 domain-containing protein [Clostridia bacterium]